MKVLMVVETIQLGEFSRLRERIISDCFGDIEQKELACAPLQTIAGFTAVKRALVILVKKSIADCQFNEKEFCLTHDAFGAPLISAFPDKLPQQYKSVLKISISHTTEIACGLATLEERGNE